MDHPALRRAAVATAVPAPAAALAAVPAAVSAAVPAPVPVARHKAHTPIEAKLLHWEEPIGSIYV